MSSKKSDPSKLTRPRVDVERHLDKFIERAEQLLARVIATTNRSQLEEVKVDRKAFSDQARAFFGQCFSNEHELGRFGMASFVPGPMRGGIGQPPPSFQELHSEERQELDQVVRFLKSLKEELSLYEQQGPGKHETSERSRMQQAFQADHDYDVFLSHASADSLAAQHVGDKIVAAGHHVFLAPKELKPGDDFAEEIRRALRGSRELWLLVSPSSSKSEWVISEWGAAWVLGMRIVPILHRCAPDSLPARLSRLQCIDLHRVDEAILRLATNTVEAKIQFRGGLPVTRKDGTVEQG